MERRDVQCYATSLTNRESLCLHWTCMKRGAGRRRGTEGEEKGRFHHTELVSNQPHLFITLPLFVVLLYKLYSVDMLQTCCD